LFYTTEVFAHAKLAHVTCVTFPWLQQHLLFMETDNIDLMMMTMYMQ